MYNCTPFTRDLSLLHCGGSKAVCRPGTICLTSAKFVNKADAKLYISVRQVCFIKLSLYIREIDNTSHKHGGQTTDWSPLEQSLTVKLNT